MIEITIKETNSQSKLVKPIDIIKSPYGQIFQEYMLNKPTKNFFISLGYDGTILIWFDEEDRMYKIATRNKNDLLSYVNNVYVKPVDGFINFGLSICK